MLELTGLKDDYVQDGRVMAEILQGYAKPLALKQSSSFFSLAAMYKQLNAPFGQFAASTLTVSTKALASTDPGDATYTSLEGQIDSLTAPRNSVAAQMIAVLNGAEFNGQVIDSGQAQSLISQGQSMLDHAQALASP